MINFNAIYVLWLREMKRFFRSPSRIVGSLFLPLLFLFAFGMGFSNIQFAGVGDVDYISFLFPGIIAMNLLFTSVSSGISVLWDREFGFLKEIMVAPVTRVSIVIGRILGGMTTAVLQAILFMLVALIFKIASFTLVSALIAFAFMLLISSTFIGVGLIFASRMKDMHGFQLIMNFVVMPIFFLSGAFYPLENMPNIVRYIIYANPLAYGVDGLRGALIGVSSLPLLTNILVLVGFSTFMVVLGALMFEKSDAV